MTSMGFESFCAACREAEFAYVKPYGLYYKGEVFWGRGLPKRGTAVRIFEDRPLGFITLVVLDLDGSFICNAWPPSWHEGDHPYLKEAMAEWNALSEAERQQRMGN